MCRHAIVEELASLGATVHTCAPDEALLNTCLMDWKAKGLHVSGSVCDVSSRPQREKLMKTVNSIFHGKLNIFVRVPIALIFVQSFPAQYTTLGYLSSLEIIIRGQCFYNVF